MTNVCVSSSFLVFRGVKAAVDDTADKSSPEYLRAREFAERAAAKKSATEAARRIHQELAQLYADRQRQGGSAANE
jgi:hypothetical protein